MSDLFKALQNMMSAKAPLKPAAAEPATGLSLADLLAKGAPNINVREEAQKKLAAFGRFNPVTVVPQDRTPKAAIPKGLFRGIVGVGPKPKLKPEENIRKLSLELLKEMGGDPDNPPTQPTYGGVQDSFELDRILKIPRRPSDLNGYPDLTDEFIKPGGTMSLWPVQNACLNEAKNAGGLLALVSAGSGKTVVSLLAAAVMGAKRAVLLIPPQLRAQLLNVDIPRYGKHFKLPLERLTVVAYSELSSAKSANILEELNPDLLICDEIHNLKSKQSARTKRFVRFMREHPNCRLVGLSGTVTRKSLKDFSHLSELALRKNSPLPLPYPTLVEWSEAIDVSKEPRPPGALTKLCTEEEVQQLSNMTDAFEVQKVVRGAFRRRLVETPGVVATEEGAIGTSLILTGLRPLVPAEIQKALSDLRDKWEISGDELVDILSVVRAGTQLAAGFFTRWLWPDGKVDQEWLDARSDWNRELREILKLSRKGLDSPLLVTNAILRGEFKSDTYAAWAELKERYDPEPPREVVWISDYLIRDAIRWGRETCDKSNPGIIWYSHDAFGRRIAEEGGFPFFGPGAEASEQIANVDVKKTPVIVASQRAHGTGKNLQMFSRNLFTTPLGGLESEQTIARSHRPGQLADEVTVDIYVHTDEMEQKFVSALREARYIEQSSGQRQKLLYAERINLPDYE